MSHDLRRISLFGIVFLVLLRISIGWQFLYEGLWKRQTLTTARPWTAKGYLLSSQGPFRSVFRGMVDDPNGLDWLDYEKVSNGWNAWEEKFVDYYQLEGLADPSKLSADEIPETLKRFPLAPGDAEKLILTFRVVDLSPLDYLNEKKTEEKAQIAQIKQQMNQTTAEVADAIRDLDNEETQEAAAGKLAQALQIGNVEQIKETTKLGTKDATHLAVLQKLAGIQKTRLKEMLHGPESYE
ncbi:MAG: hypothetical protein KDA84_24750, partial [Planctomycetaceae bacterium]|nr:hypothetical protein [Planctomycetaceae bacterium]